jgi:hypothetical protein
VRDVHRIGILDVRLFNTDRHAGNILVLEPGMGPVDPASHKVRLVISKFMSNTEYRVCGCFSLDHYAACSNQGLANR